MTNSTYIIGATVVKVALADDATARAIARAAASADDDLTCYPDRVERLACSIAEDIVGVSHPFVAAARAGTVDMTVPVEDEDIGDQHDRERPIIVAAALAIRSRWTVDPLDRERVIARGAIELRARDVAHEEVR